MNSVQTMVNRNDAVWFLALSLIAFGFSIDRVAYAQGSSLDFRGVPNLPDKIGVAGPIVGVHNDVLIVAGGANFANADDPNLWDLEKQYHRTIWVMRRNVEGGPARYQWTKKPQPDLMQPVAYSAVVSTPYGIVCMAGENPSPTNRVFLLTWDKEKEQVVENDLVVPDLPQACTGGGAAVVGNYIYLVAGQLCGDDQSKSASRVIWRLDMSMLADRSANNNERNELWETVTEWPDSGPPRMFPLVCSQHDGYRQRLYIIGGRHFLEGSDKTDENNLRFLNDGWSFDPLAYEAGNDPWNQLTESPVPFSAGTAVAVGQAHIAVLGYADGSVLKQQLDSGKPMSEFEHPGFPKLAYKYHTITDKWTTYSQMPVNQVTTQAVQWGEGIFLVSGEIKPRVRSNNVWLIVLNSGQTKFGTVNFAVVFVYLLVIVAVGVHFAAKNKNTDDYFRGGKSIPWWAAGCSIFATMLSSITYMAIPAKAFATDWVYALGNAMILVVAPVAIYVALPFYRRLDVTSAYEYLEKRFNRTARLIGSASFSLFHIFRMGVVLALAALALSSITGIAPIYCVLIMGVLAIVYCTLGGIEAVIWTDTIQTFVLVGGALLCIACAFIGAESGSLAAASDAGKFQMVNVDFGSTSFMIMAIWVVVLGGMGQNISSYTADQAVIQRYMTTRDQKAAARSIWLNGIMAIPTAVIFFGMGTAFWMFYWSHPEKLDPAIAGDRIMPYFISHELPIGLAGLVVAGIFAAAQSTVSTSMNSGATTIVTDFLQPFKIVTSQSGLLWSARMITLAMGVLGTLAGLLFVDPTIKSLFDQFIGILGMFLGVLAGLFALGALTRRASGVGSLIGAFVAIVLMAMIVAAANEQSLLGISPREIFDSMNFSLYKVNGYLYAFIGITVCFTVGYLASLVFPGKQKDLAGLTVFKE